MAPGVVGPPNLEKSVIAPAIPARAINTVIAVHPENRLVVKPDLQLLFRTSVDHQAM